jgi:serine/threonine protein kinase
MSPQQTIAHYRITSKLGEGGMGEVWRATDTKLSREVAIKILPAEFAADPDRLARFSREAQVLASLNHPNIAQIYGVEDRALIMELVEGETLHGPLPVETALDYARQIAEALEDAHENSIVHRDLKPANIKVTPGGRVKVLDFGLAKAFAGEAAAGNPASSPTLTMRATQAGIILGTAAYMSPEQARGQVVDRRADIWAFGVVLYEMLTGRRLFDAPTISDTLAAVLRAEPDWSALPAGLPANIHTLLRRCLERDPRRRLRDIGDARLELEQPAAEPHAVAPAPKPRRLPWIAAAIMTVAAAALSLVHFREAPAPAPPVVRFSVVPPEKGAFGPWMALSPDGRHFAFTASGSDGVTRIWVRSLDSLELRSVVDTETNLINIFFWAPDSRTLIFQSGDKIRKVDIAGGAPHSLCDAADVMLSGSGNSSGVLLFGSNSGPVYRVSSAGGPSSPVTRFEPSRNESYHSDPIFLPDGVHFLYFRHSSTAEYQGVFVGSLDVKPEQQSLQRIQSVEFSPGYVPPRDGSSIGHLLFLRNETLMAQPFDQRRLETAGDPVPIAEQVGTVLSRAFFSVSPTGVLAYRSGVGVLLQLVWYDREGRIAGHPGERADYLDVALSPDGNRAAYSRSNQSTGRQIWILDFARGVQNRFTFQAQGARSPVWSPDGRHLAFGSQGGREIYVQEVNGSSNAVPVYAAQGAGPSDWSRDGRFLIISQPLNRYDLAAIPDPLRAGTHQAIPVANSTFSEMHGQVSPDGRYFAYTSNESGQAEIYVCPFPPGDGRSGKWLVSSGGGAQPRWRGDGKEIFYLDPGHRMMAADISTQAGFQSSTPHPLFTSPAISGTQLLFQYDVTRDGKRFLMIGPIEGSVTDPATIVLNWEALLKK